MINFTCVKIDFNDPSIEQPYNGAVISECGLADLWATIGGVDWSSASRVVLENIFSKFTNPSSGRLGRRQFGTPEVDYKITTRNGNKEVVVYVLQTGHGVLTSPEDCFSAQHVYTSDGGIMVTQINEYKESDNV